MERGVSRYSAKSSGQTLHFWRSESSLNVLNDRAMELLEDVGLGQITPCRPQPSLSYGRRRALESRDDGWRWIRELLLLDEPTSGMGREDIGRTADLDPARLQGSHRVMVEHNLSVVVGSLRHFITVLSRGEVLAEGPYSEVSKNPEVVEAYMGTGLEANHG